MTFAIITPVHWAASDYLLQAFESLKAQTEPWHWYISRNDRGAVPSVIFMDERVTVIDGSPPDVKISIGALKKRLCAQAEEPYIVELDYDDVLEPNALEELARAFNTGADFVYSDFACFEDAEEPYTVGQINPRYRRVACPPYGSQHGWYTYEHTSMLDGTKLNAMRSFPVTAQNIRTIEFAPNHVRAWSAAAYETVGGHAESYPLMDDHDLIVRMYLSNMKFVHIPKCLYLYREHERNTVKQLRHALPYWRQESYEKNVVLLAESWARREKLRLLNMAWHGATTPEGYEQIFPDTGGHIVPGSVGVIRSFDALQHSHDGNAMMNMFYNMLAPGGFLFIRVPSSNGKAAFCAQSHKTFWNDLSWRYFTDPEYAKFEPEFRGRFQLIKNLEFYPTPWHETNKVPYCDAHFIKLAEGYTPAGIAWR